MLRKDLATALGISVQMVGRLKKRGMPVDSISSAQKWRNRNLQISRTREYRADGNSGKRISGRERRPAGRVEDADLDIGQLDDRDLLDRPGMGEATMFNSAAIFAERHGIERYGALLIHLAIVMSDEGHAVSHEVGEVPEAVWDAWDGLDAAYERLQAKDAP
jgi:hypothetical protein